MIIDFSLNSSDGEHISVSVHGNENISNNKCLVYIHGFKGFKDWGFVPFLAKSFAESGFFVLTFNFSYNGIGSNKEEFTELEKFAANTFSREIFETGLILDHVKKGFFGNNKSTKVGLLGHSRGGAIALLSAVKSENVNAVATWAAISKLNRYSERQKIEWRKNGFFEVINSRTNQVMRLHIGLLNDIEENLSGSLNLEYAVKNLGKPLLIAHGDQDLAVPISEGNQLYEWADKSKTEFYRITKTGHTFDCQHPFVGSNEKFDKLLTKTELFFKNHLN